MHFNRRQVDEWGLIKARLEQEWGKPSSADTAGVNWNVQWQPASSVTMAVLLANVAGVRVHGSIQSPQVWHFDLILARTSCVEMIERT